ncbi:MAG: undecaprenyldiphospho-muramoylpentapeptide beta-N-acetylglucosaminyltransferase [Deltaproteobacteria bacterium]|nr:undecaprenyldiphospho-muramoylpentapeptide beta-N-acetylglucosaminyltransferase [Deltaproteobacteria bacterium]
MTRILLAGGGTGGHVFPLLAVAERLRELAPESVLTFVGTERGLEARLVPERGYPLELVRVAPLRGGGVRGAASGALVAARSLPAAFSLVRRLDPNVVLSIGGYAAGPVSIAAWARRVPLCLVEPNAAIGLSNRAVAPLVKRAYTAFEASAGHFPRAAVRRTGVPIRAGFRPTALPSGTELRVLVLGGSQGAASLNDAVPRAIAASRGALRVLHQCGAGRDGAVRELYASLGLGGRAEVVPFLDDMPAALAAAHLVIGRAGAGAVAEICAVGRPSLLVPYPFAGDHQRWNAAELVEAGAATMITSAEATPERLTAELDRLAGDRDRLEAMARAARALGRPDAALEIARDVIALAEGRESAGRMS